MIKKYNSFREDSLLEGIINESMIYFSPKVRVMFNNIKDNPIAKDLLDTEGKDVKPDITLLNLDDKEGYLSFITMKNTKKLLDERWPESKDKFDLDVKSNVKLADDIWKLHNDEWHDIDYGTPLRGMGVFDDKDPYEKSRNSVKLGKLVNNIFPKKYTDKDVESFVNLFKSIISKSSESFELVDGEEIDFWYDADNYVSLNGSLGNSCMARKKDLFKIYNQNGDICKLLILKEGDKILGRSIIWKLNSISPKDLDQDKWFMDRQYTINESDVEKFRKYAKEKGWYYKSYNNHHSYSTVTIDDKGTERNCEMTVKVEAKDYDRYPYMDTFKRYNPDDGMLYNDDDNDSDNNGQYILNETDGSYEEIEGGVWSEYLGRRIPEDEAVWSDYEDTYIIRDDAVQVTHGSRRNTGWYPDDSDNIVYDEWLDEYICEEDAVWSEPYSHYLLEDNAVGVIISILEDGDVPSEGEFYHVDDDDIMRISYFMSSDKVWYEKLSNKFSDWSNCDYILKQLFEKNYQDLLIPSIFRLETYKLKTPINGVEYLSEVDALAMGVKIDKSLIRLIDMFHYEDTILSIRDKIKLKLKSEIDRIREVVDGKGQLQLKFSDKEKEEYIEKLKKILSKLNIRFNDISDDEYL